MGSRARIATPRAAGAPCGRRRRSCRAAEAKFTKFTISALPVHFRRAGGVKFMKFTVSTPPVHFRGAGRAAKFMKFTVLEMRVHFRGRPGRAGACAPHFLFLMPPRIMPESMGRRGE